MIYDPVPGLVKYSKPLPFELPVRFTSGSTKFSGDQMNKFLPETLKDALPNLALLTIDCGSE